MHTRARLFQQDLDTQLQPILDYLTSLGLDAQHAARMACVYPELLLSSVPDQLQPLVGYLQALGCSSAQAARLLQVRWWKLGCAEMSTGACTWGGFCWCGCNGVGRRGASSLFKYSRQSVGKKGWQSSTAHMMIIYTWLYMIPQQTLTPALSYMT